ncbi:TRIO and F-actin-binding protein-like isoform X2 [Arapaima gigas]
MTPDLLNFKKGWMSKLDENGEWKKHWFVLTDAALKYYRDSAAEEKDDLDGEIDLRSCVKVSEFDVEKNYGFQIQTVSAVFTLSAMTTGIRKNWIEVLRKSVRPISSPDALNDPKSGVVPSPAAVVPHRFDYVELAPVGEAAGTQHSSRRVPGEGQSREKGVIPTPEQKQRLEEEIEKKWAELEKISLKKMSLLPLMGSLGDQSANEALQREVVASLRQQLEQLENGGGGVGAGGVCHGGSGSPCGRSLVAMERAHRQALLELQRCHDREMRELERERDKLLQEEAQATAQAVEVLKKAHQEEMEQELERIRKLGGGGGTADMEALQKQQQLEKQALQRELDSLSERYSQKCLELNRAMKNSGEREREISRKEREMEQLRKENQELQSRLTEEISCLQSLVTVQGSENNNREQNSCELEVLLRMKENEVQYLHKEIVCLRDELQSLNMEKQAACDRYKEVDSELRMMKSRSEREVETLREHLRLAMAALREGQQLGNSLDH